MRDAWVQKGPGGGADWLAVADAVIGMVQEETKALRATVERVKVTPTLYVTHDSGEGDEDMLVVRLSDLRAALSPLADKGGAEPTLLPLKSEREMAEVIGCVEVDQPPGQDDPTLVRHYLEAHVILGIARAVLAHGVEANVEGAMDSAHELWGVEYNDGNRADLLAILRAAVPR
jgi:hypothetical protein